MVMSPNEFKDNVLGKELLRVVGGSRLRGNYKSDSDYDRYVIYLPRLETYLTNEKNYSPYKDEEANVLYIPVNCFYQKLLKGDFLAYELYSAIQHGKYEMIESNFKSHFKSAHVNDVITSKDFLSMNSLKVLMHIFDGAIKNLDKKEDKALEMKQVSIIYGFMYELLELSKNGVITFPLKEYKILTQIKYDEEFYDANRENILKNIETVKDIILKAMEKSEESITKHFPEEINIEACRRKFVNSIYYLVNYLYIQPMNEVEK